jgi:hypothetical protein
MMAGLLLAVLLYRPIYQKIYSLSDLTKKHEIKEEYAISHTITALEGTQDSVKTVSKQHIYTDGSKYTETTREVTNSEDGPEVVNELLLNTTSFWIIVGLVFIQVVFVTMVYGPIAAFLVELFPTRIRYTSMSFPYHIGNGIFGGLTPLLATSLYEASKTEINPEGDPIAGLWYPILVASLTFVVGMFFLSNKVKGEVME